MGFRIAARVDGNQSSIVKGLRKCGYSVLIISQLKNCCDIVVGAGNRNYLFEIKDPAKVQSKRKLTEGEEKFFQSWNGQVSLIESTEDALLIIKNSRP